MYRNATGKLDSEGENDTYWFSGNISGFSPNNSSVKTFIDGYEVDPELINELKELRIEAKDSAASYDFTVNGDLVPDPTLDPSIMNEDNNGAQGAVYPNGDPHTFWFANVGNGFNISFNGNKFASFESDGNPKIIIEGFEVNPHCLDSGHPKCWVPTLTEEWPSGLGELLAVATTGVAVMSLVVEVLMEFKHVKRIKSRFD